MQTKLGIIAGGGTVPGQLIQAARSQGRDCFVLAIKNIADPEQLIGVDHVWLRLGQLGRAFELLHEKNVGDVVIIPQGVPHGWSEITDHVDYLSVRPDPERVLAKDYVNPHISK